MTSHIPWYRRSAYQRADRIVHTSCMQCRSGYLRETIISLSNFSPLNHLNQKFCLRTMSKLRFSALVNFRKPPWVALNLHLQPLVAAHRGSITKMDRTLDILTGGRAFTLRGLFDLIVMAVLYELICFFSSLLLHSRTTRGAEDFFYNISLSCLLNVPHPTCIYCLRKIMLKHLRMP